MSQNGFRLEASDWEKMMQACFPAALQNLWAPQTGRHKAFSSEGFGGLNLAFPKGFGVFAGSLPPTIGQKMAASKLFLIRSSIAESQLPKSNF